MGRPRNNEKLIQSLNNVMKEVAEYIDNAVAIENYSDAAIYKEWKDCIGQLMDLIIVPNKN